jgi:hypothetical protein
VEVAEEDERGRGMTNVEATNDESNLNDEGLNDETGEVAEWCWGELFGEWVEGGEVVGVVGDEVAGAFFCDFVAFGGEEFFEGGDAAGIFGVEFAVVFEGSPVGGDFGGASLAGFFGGVVGEPTEDAGGDGAGDGGAVLGGEGGAEVVDGGELAFGDLTHEGIDLERGGDDAGVAGFGAPAADHFAGDGDGLGEVFGGVEFFVPRLLRARGHGGLRREMGVWGYFNNNGEGWE